jgi:hypothetical protein
MYSGDTIEAGPAVTDVHRHYGSRFVIAVRPAIGERRDCCAGRPAAGLLLIDRSTRTEPSWDSGSCFEPMG